MTGAQPHPNIPIYLATLGPRSLEMTGEIADGWIGTSFYFMALDYSLDTKERKSEGVYGTAWEVHGGGFYHVEKYTVAPATLPDVLHWFKWEAYTTWLSGMGLLELVYYMAAFVIGMFGEAAFASYTVDFGTHNVLGHLYKVAAFYLIYRGAFAGSVRKPYLALTDANERLRREVLERQDAEENNALNVTMTITGGKILDWYPIGSKIQAVKAISMKNSPGKAEISFVLKSFNGTMNAGEKFEPLLIYSDGRPNRRGATITVTLNPA